MSLELVGSKDTLDRPARDSGVRWYRHVLRRNIDVVLQKALDFKVVGKRG